MAYARLSSISDVYVMETSAGFTCVNCAFRHAAPWDHVTATADAMVTHLLTHRAAGDRVPEAALTRLREEGSG